MSEQTVFCPECREDVRYSVIKREETAKLKGETYEFVSHIAFCEKCGEEIYVALLEDRNLKALYDAYRQRHDIISLENIRAIPEKYGIGKRPLSLLLGWGELTFSRYYDGDIPTKQYSQILKKIYSDPVYYLSSLLEGNKDKLKSDKTYEKSKAETEKLLNNPEGQMTKMDIVVDYLLSGCRDITPLSLQKVLYYVQGFHSAFYGTFLFTEECEAWIHGPVYPDVYRWYKKYCFDPIDGVNEFDVSLLSVEEKILLDSIIRNVCCYSGKTLESFTHTETPWSTARSGLPADAISKMIIHRETIGSYFSSVKKKYHMLNPANIKDYMHDMFSQV
ncbi:MAG: DUF4065 domain-containing protein [Synergistaceae bacterium]|nr:DUF4065 domain-containing protein [Synergistaceae bacterium]